MRRRPPRSGAERPEKTSIAERPEKISEAEGSKNYFQARNVINQLQRLRIEPGFESSRFLAHA